jgi:superfamily II DNA or RNA helicase
MSIKINSIDLSNEQIAEINSDLLLKIENSKYNKFGPQKTVQAYALENEIAYLPFSYAIQKIGLKRPERSSFPPMITKFVGALRDEQEAVKKEAIQLLSKKGSVIISLGTGMGKTITSINIAVDIKLKTLILVNKIVLINQWEEAIKKVCPFANIQKLTGKTDELDSERDFFIMNASNVSKKNREFYKDISLVICDEVHLIMAETLSKSLQYITPRYLIGLSATPYREDGLDILLNLYFGEDKIIRLLKRKHLVYKVHTGLSIDMIKTDEGKINWGAIIDEQANNQARNELIVSISKKFKDRNIIILTKRIEQGKYLYERLKEEGEYVDSLLGKQQDFDRECRILIGTVSKISVGFDFPKLDCLIFGCDLESYAIQSIGRVLRRVDVEPIIFDLIDDNFILNKHYKTREQIYNDVGGRIVNYYK